MPDPNTSRVADNIIDIAEAIARAAPECADMALEIVALARELDAQPDRASIQDALETNLADDVSDTQIQVATSAVASAVRNSG